MEDLLKKFYEGKTTPEEEAALGKESYDDPVDERTVKTTLRYFEQFKNVAPEKLHKIDNFAAHPEISYRRYWQLAASFLIGVIAFGAGYFSYQFFHQPTQEISKLELELMQSRLSLIEATLSRKDSQSMRKGLAMVSQMDRLDDRLIDELISILNSSDHINIRLMALEQLSRYVDSRPVREKIFATIQSQDSEFVLAEIARLAIIVQDQSAGKKILEKMKDISGDSIESLPLKKELEILL